MQWHVATDEFTFEHHIKNLPATRRGILSTISGIYDPLGFISPFILIGKSILQGMCKTGVGWDDPLPVDLLSRWEDWELNLADLPKIKIPRCIQSTDVGDIVKIEVHHFSDASVNGYGQCSYIRLVGQQRVHC